MCDGHCVYQGEAKLSANYFRNLGFNLPTYSNPADSYMRFLAVSYPATEKDVRKVNFLRDKYESLISKSVDLENSSLILPTPDIAKFSKSENNSFIAEFKQLVWRNKIAIQRDPMQSKAKIG